MTEHNCDEYLDEIQDRMGEDIFKVMLEFMAQRLMLHATTIEFEHPVTGVRVKGLSPCPF